MTPALATGNTGSLFTLQSALIDLLEERERCICAVREAEGEEHREAEAELDAINAGIASFVRDKLTTVDELRAPLKAMEQAAVICKADAQEALNQAAMWMNRHDRLKDLIKLAMEQLEQAGQWKPKETRKFESPRGSFTLRGNGGKRPIDITDESLLPDEVCYAEIRMPFPVWKIIRAYLEARRGNGASAEEQFSMAVKRVHSLTLIGEALAKRCDACEGDGMDDALGGIPCRQCGGSGSAGVPGARLAPRAQSLVVR
jgi:tetratricopeptide (TPR) repeat protein